MQIKITEAAATSFWQRYAHVFLRMGALLVGGAICVSGGSLIMLSLTDTAFAPLIALMGLSVFLAGILLAKAGQYDEACVLQYDRSVAAWVVTEVEGDQSRLAHVPQSRADSIELGPDHVVMRDYTNKRLLQLRLAPSPLGV